MKGADMSDAIRKRKVFKPGLILGTIGVITAVLSLVQYVILIANGAQPAPNEPANSLAWAAIWGLEIIGSYYALTNKMARALLYVIFGIELLASLAMIVMVVPKMQGAETMSPIILSVIYIAFCIWLMYALYQRSHDPFLNIGK